MKACAALLRNSFLAFDEWVDSEVFGAPVDVFCTLTVDSKLRSSVSRFSATKALALSLTDSLSLISTIVESTAVL